MNCRVDCSPAANRVLVQIRGAAAPDNVKPQLLAAGWDCTSRGAEKFVLTGLEVGSGKPVAIFFNSSVALLEVAKCVRVGGRVELMRAWGKSGSIDEYGGQYEVYNCPTKPEVVVADAVDMVLGRPVGAIMEPAALKAVMDNAGEQNVVIGLFVLPMVMTEVRMPVSEAAPAVMIGKCCGTGDAIAVKLWGAKKAPMKQAFDDMERNVGALVIVVGSLKKGEAHRPKLDVNCFITLLRRLAVD